ncbi:hypothetical protein SAMD00019534_084870, partial [Acytostelium subglobosum LB1]|uniref:hypothetical protein n=1 Tax=Acytostelium subglobosum LB1 TaxID=1410327 RepID=UPI000644F721
MSITVTSIYISSAFHIAFIILHLCFWRLLKWDEQLKRLSADNKAVMQTLNLCLTLLFVLLTVLFNQYMDEVITTSLGQALFRSVGLFWVFRAILQVLLFNLKSTVDQIFLGLFIFGSYIHLM